MQPSNQIERSPYLEVLEKQKEVLAQLTTAFEASWKRAVDSDWRIDPQICPEEVMADLAYGRD